MEFSNPFSVACWDAWCDLQSVDLWDFGPMYCMGGEL